MTTNTLTATATTTNGSHPHSRPQATTIRDLEGSTGTLPVLGYTVQWNLRHVEISHQELVKTLQRVGFITTGPGRPSPTTALRRALVRWLHNRATALNAPQLEGSLEFELGEADDWDEEDDFSSGAATTTTETTGTAGRKGPESGNSHAPSRSRSRSQKNLIRKINNPQSDWLVFGLVVEHLDLAALGLSYATRLRVFLHKKTGTIRVSQAEAGIEPDAPDENENENGVEFDTEADDGATDNEGLAHVRQEVERLFHHYREHHQARDVSRLLRLIVNRLDSFSLRRLGGVYFVPQQHQPELDHVRKVVEGLPAPAGEVSDKFLLILPILDGAGAKKGLAGAAHRDFMAELATMQVDLDRLAGEAENHRVRAATVAGRLKEYRELRAKAEVYAELLDMQGEKVLASLQKLTGQATQLLESVAEPLPLSEQIAFNWDTASATASDASHPEETIGSIG